MRVAFLSFDFGEYCIRLASALARQADVLLLLPLQQAAPHLPLLEQTVNFQPFHKPRMRQPLQQLRMLRTLVRYIRRFDPDVLHLQQGHLWFNLVLPFLKQYPLVLTIHDPRHHIGDREAQKFPQVIVDFGFRRAAQAIVHGKALKHVVVEDLHFPSEHVHVIPHIVLGDSTAQPQVREDGHLILFFGRIWAYKGLEYLIRAEPLITARVSDAKIVIAGEGEDFARYRRLMVHPDTFIVHNEYVPHDKRTALFRQASIVVLPYTDASQSGVIPLAYTFAKPVVATTVGSLPEMVEHGHTGYLVPPRDEKALADAIVRLLEDQELRQQYGANGKHKIDVECSPSAVAQQTLAVYHYAINSVQLSGSKENP
jgi:glycosyltransferase involved in cell wall biosynthesis